MSILTLIAAVSFGAIVLIWFGYPVAMSIIARAYAHRAMRPVYFTPSHRSVSVVLATRDSTSAIIARTQNLRETDHPSELLEIIVALDGAGAGASAVEPLAADSQLRIVEGEMPGGKATALNAGVRAARGEILVMADAGQRFDRRTIPELVAALEDERFGAVSGALELGGDHRSPVALYWQMEKRLRFNEAVVASAIGVTGAVYATRRALWPTIPAGTLLDDVYVPMQLVLAGHRVGFMPTARATDAREFTHVAEGVRKTRTLTGVMQLRHLIPAINSPTQNPVWMQFVAHKLARLLTPYLAVVFAVSTSTILLICFVHAESRTQGAMVFLIALSLAIPAVRARAVGLTRWIIAMQLATVRASVNGVRGRWQVWTR